MKPRALSAVALAATAIALLAVVPRVADGYWLSLAITLLNYTVLATAWALFSGPTRYVSLATVAFFGIGAYTVAVFGELAAKGCPPNRRSASRTRSALSRLGRTHTSMSPVARGTPCAAMA